MGADHQREQESPQEDDDCGGCGCAAVLPDLYVADRIYRQYIVGGPDHLKGYYQMFLAFHIVLATVAAVFGLTTLVLGFREKYAKHRKWGRVTSVIWFCSAITGVVVYVLLYILYPGGHTKPVWEVILGM